MNYYRQLFLETVPEYKKVERQRIQGTRQWYTVFAKVGDEFIQEERMSNTPANAARGFINHTLTTRHINMIKRLNQQHFIFIKYPGEHVAKRFKQAKRDQIITDKLAVIYIYGIEEWEDLIEIVAAPTYVDPKVLRDILYKVRNGISIEEPDIEIETELF